VTDRETAEILVLLAADWLGRRAADGDPPPGPMVQAALAQVAAGAPRLAVTRRSLMRALEPRAACQVKALAAALDASEMAAAASGGGQWVSAAQAGQVLALRPDSVRWLLRRGLIDGYRDARGAWRVSSRSLAAYEGRRQGG
jgi:hypothetical protein